MKKILAVEDSPEIHLVIEASLSDFLVVLAPSLAEARKQLEKDVFAGMILDISLPDGDGLEFFARVRQDARWRDLPVIFLTGKTDLSSKLAAFSLGAEDFLTKPFEAAELRARVQARLKRMDEIRDGDLRVQDLMLNKSQMKVWISKGTQRAAVSLTSTEFRLLALLLRHMDRIYDRDTIINEVWGNETHVLDRTVDTHVSHLRKKIAQSRVHIEAVPGEGYRAVVK
jgi:DNA-binding response OmpR family regulator